MLNIVFIEYEIKLTYLYSIFTKLRPILAKNFWPIYKIFCNLFDFSLMSF